MVSTEFACFKQMADSLVEEFDDGLHGSTRPGNRSRIVSQWTSDTQRPRARAVRGSAQGVPQTDATLARSRSVCVSKCSAIDVASISLGDNKERRGTRGQTNVLEANTEREYTYVTEGGVRSADWEGD